MVTYLATEIQYAGALVQQPYHTGEVTAKAIEYKITWAMLTHLIDQKKSKR